MSVSNDTMQSARFLLVGLALGVVAVLVGGTVGGILFLIAFVLCAVMALSIVWNLVTARRASRD